MGFAAAERVTDFAHVWRDSDELAERVGLELALERKFNDMQRTGCAFYACGAMVVQLIVV